MPIVIDGYNFIFQDNRLRAHVDRGDLAAARDALVDALAALSGHCGGEVTVVFDGGESGAHLPQYQSRAGVRIVFADPASSADERILEIIQGRPPASAWKIVTNDQGLTRSATRAGARAVSCKQLRESLARNSARAGEDAPPDDEPRGKYGAVEPWEVDYWAREFGLE